jgi:hypothetical protein
VGRLTVLRRISIATTKKGARWECRCDCGALHQAWASDLRHYRPVRSCGCGLKSKNPSETGNLGSPEYISWQAIRNRCSDKSNRRYGGRGIVMYQPWFDSFQDFFEYMGPRPSPDHSVDRIDNDGNYEPGNVRWATRIEQARNRSTSKIVFMDAAFIAHWLSRGYKASHVAEAFGITDAYAWRVARNWRREAT